MQVGGLVQGAGAIHLRRRLEVLLAIAAIVVIAAVVALVASGVGAMDAIPKAQTPWVTLYDDEGNAHLVHVRTGGAEDAPPWVRLYDDEGNVHLVTGTDIP
jgi:selenocysteine lyase/cysteine desulfurase